MKESASSLAQILRSLPGISSGPVALCSLMLRRSLRTPGLDTLMLGMQGKELELGMLLSKGPGVEKTEENWMLKSSAFVFWILYESVAVENVGNASVFLMHASNVGVEFFVVCVVFGEVVDIGVVSLPAESLGVFFHVFVFLLCFWAVSLFRFRVPPLFLSEDSFSGSGDPGLVKFGGGDFGGDVVVKEEEEVSLKAVPNIVNVSVIFMSGHEEVVEVVGIFPNLINVQLFPEKNLTFSGLFAGEVNAHLNIDNFVIADAGDDRVVNNEVGVAGEEDV